MVAVTPVLRLSPAGQTVGGLEGLGIRPGQTIQAKVLEVLQGGTVRIAIAGQELQVSTETLLRPGSDILLKAERDGQLLRLLVLGGSDVEQPVSAANQQVSARPVLTPAVTELVRQAHAELLRSLQANEAALPSSSSSQQIITRPADNAAATLERFLQYAAPAAARASQSAQPLLLTPQQKTVLASIANGFSELAATTRKPLPEILRQTVARLLSIPTPPVPAQYGVPVSAPAVQSVAPLTTTPLVPRDAVSVLFASLANVVTQGDVVVTPAIRETIARLFDLPPQPAPNSVEQELLPETAERAGLARSAALFDVAARLAGASDSLPQPLRQILQQLLGLRLQPTTIASAQGLQAALRGSGLLHETLLAQSLPGTLSPADLKAVLLVLRAALHSFTGSHASADGKDGSSQPRPVAFASQPAEVQSLARSLLTQTEAHLARLRLSQFAATPDRIDSGQSSRVDAPDYSGQIALADGARTALLQFHIEREPQPPEGEELAAWSVRFSLDLEATGFLQTLVVLRGRKLRIRFRTERHETSQLFEAGEALLRSMLADVGLEVEDIAVTLMAPRPGPEGCEARVDRLT